MRKGLSTVRILWFAIATSSVILVALLKLMRMPTVAPEPLMLPGLAVVATAMAVASFVVPPRIFAVNFEKVREHLVEQLDAEAETGFREPAPTRKVLPDTAAAQRAFAVAIQQPLVLELALTESVALMGLMARQLGFPALFSVPFFLVAWVLFALRFPTLARWRGLAQKYLGADLPP